MANTEEYYRHLRYKTGLTETSNATSDKVAIVRYIVPRQGLAKAWLFAKETSVTAGDATTITRGVPTNFNGYLFSSAQALIDYCIDKGYGTPDLPELARLQKGLGYTGNPSDYIIIGGPSVDTVTSGNAIEAPMPNYIQLPWDSHDWVPYSCDDQLVDVDPDTIIYGVVVFPSSETLTKLYTRLIVS